MTTLHPVDQTVLASIRAIVDYDMATERADYERQHPDDREGHVFLHLERVAAWLADAPAEEVACDHADALKLIATECEASEEAIAFSLESGVPIATRAWKRGESAPYPDKLEAVEYTVYPREDDDLEDENFQRGSRSVSQKITLWVGLHPEMGCVNVDAGRERLESEGWEVTDWGAA